MCEWGTTVRLTPPSLCLTPNRKHNTWVEVDSCLIDAVLLLWAHGYATLSACCSHGHGVGEILVAGRVLQPDPDPGIHAAAVAPAVG